MAGQIFEALILAAAGAALGLLFATVAIRYFGTAAGNILDAFWMDFRMDWMIAAFATTLGVSAAVLAGMAPALRASRLDVTATLKDGAARGSSLRIGRVSRTLIGVQVAFACGLLIATGVFVQSAIGLRATAFPYDTQAIFTAQLATNFSLGGTVEYQYEARNETVRALAERLERVPAVTAVALANVVPGRDRNNWSFSLDGEVFARPEDVPETTVTFITPGYLEALESMPRRGRDFRWQDDATSPGVALVNDPWVAAFSADRDPVGRRLSVAGATAAKGSRRRGIASGPTSVAGWPPPWPTRKPAALRG
jgi:hypothetical protein